MTAAVLTYPTLHSDPINKYAVSASDVLGWAGDFLWPPGNGPFENLFRLIEFGSYFVLPGIAQAAMFLASLFGYSIQAVGAWIDRELGFNTIKDVASANTSQVVEKISGGLLTVPNVQRSLGAMQQVPGSLSAGAFLALEQIVKYAQDPMDFGDRRPLDNEPDTPVDETDKQRKEREVRQQASLETKSERKAREKFERLSKEKPNTNATRRSYEKWQALKTKRLELSGLRQKHGLIGGTLRGLKGAKGKGVLVAALITVVGWAISAASNILKAPAKGLAKHPVRGLTGATAVGVTDFMTGRNYGPNYDPGESNDLGINKLFGGATESYLNKREDALLKRQPKTWKGQLEFAVDQVMTGAY